MKRFIFAVAVLAVCGASADAGPLRNLACKVRDRVTARPHVRQVVSDVKAVADARPVARIVYGVAQVAAVRATNCPGGVCPK